MKPTLNAIGKKEKLPFYRGGNDWVLVNCWAARHQPLERGDIVVFLSPKDPTDCLIKRLVAVEGDVITNKRYSDNPITIPKGHIWVEGDNSKVSLDSLKYGPIPSGLVFGKVNSVLDVNNQNILF